MTHPISRNQHILGDYLYGPLIALAPMLVGFRSDSTPTLLCYLIGAALFGAALLTRAELSLVRVIPFRLHLAGDALNGLFCLVAPWLFGFSADMLARNTFLALGVLGLLAAGLSRPVEMPSGEMPIVGGRQRDHVLAH